MDRFSPAKLRARREAAGLTRPSLAFAVGRDPDSVKKWEKGRFVPRADSLLALTQALDCHVEDLFEEVGVNGEA